MTDAGRAILEDLIARTEQAVASVAGRAAHTSTGFVTEDVVDAVERHLPDNYPALSTGPVTRRDLIKQIAQDVLTGDLYEGGGS
jgi:hypothetical protein